MAYNEKISEYAREEITRQFYKLIKAYIDYDGTVTINFSRLPREFKFAIRLPLVIENKIEPPIIDAYQLIEMATPGIAGYFNNDRFKNINICMYCNKEIVDGKCINKPRIDGKALEEL